MSTDVGEHLTKGDAEPTIDPDKITLYETHLCPFCQRVRYTLDYHGIPYDRILISGGSKPDWFLKVNPMGKVPLLLHHGQNMIDSEAIMKYVDQLRGPENSLMRFCGEDGFQKALDMSSSIACHRGRLCSTRVATKDDADFFKAVLSNIDKAIQGPYLLGENMSLADLALFPFFNAWEYVMSRLMELDEASGDNVEAYASQWPEVVRYRQLMSQMPFIRKTFIEDNDSAKLMDNFNADKPDVSS
ncbi:hypothetical protein AAHC03_019159 [Spirometra sp. Aus1]